MKRTILDILNTKISYLDEVDRKRTNDEDISIFDWLFVLPNRYKSQVNKCRKLYKDYLISGNKREYTKYKKYLPCITPSCLFKDHIRREDSKNYEMSGIIVIDIDGLKNEEEVNETKIKAIKFPSCIAAGKSVSGYGVWAMIVYNKNNNFKQTWYALKTEFENMGITIDTACKDFTRTRFISFDDNVLLRKCIIPHIEHNYINEVPDNNVDIFSIYNYDNDDIYKTKFIFDYLNYEFEVFDKVEILPQTDITFKEYDENYKLTDEEANLLTKSIDYLVNEQNYGNDGCTEYKTYDYQHWFSDGSRLSSLSNKKLGYELFLKISRNDPNFKDENDVKEKFKIWTQYKYYTDKQCLSYFYGLCKKYLGTDWKNKLNTKKYINKQYGKCYTTKKIYKESMSF